MIERVGNVLQPVGNYNTYAMDAVSRGYWNRPIDFPLPVDERLPSGTCARPQPTKFYERPPIEAPTTLAASPKAYAPRTELVEGPLTKDPGRPLYRSGTTFVTEQHALPAGGRGAAESTVAPLLAAGYGEGLAAPFGIPWWALAVAGAGLWWMSTRKGRA